MQKDCNLETLAQSVITKIKHYLVVSLGRTAEDAYDEEFYR
ncbi:MAG TPA: hypothetical protein PLO43_03465 [Chlamydiales bacterium]|nr:hypothetical protein [Chlamydiales bacterium]